MHKILIIIGRFTTVEAQHNQGVKYATYGCWIAANAATIYAGRYIASRWVYCGIPKSQSRTTIGANLGGLGV